MSNHSSPPGDEIAARLQQQELEIKRLQSLVDDFVRAGVVDTSVALKLKGQAEVNTARLCAALEDVTEHLANQRDMQLNNGYPEEYAAVEKARAVLAALAASPAPQETDR